MQAFLSPSLTNHFLQSCNIQIYPSTKGKSSPPFFRNNQVSIKSFNSIITNCRVQNSENNDQHETVYENIKLEKSSSYKLLDSNLIYNPFILAEKIFLPTSWPSSVASRYIEWVRWHIGRHIFRNAYYVLGTTSLLTSLGFDTTSALAIGTTLKWVLKDGLGMATKLIVSARLASIVDTNPKKWRFLGDSLMAISAAVEILSVINPSLFLLYGSIAALLRDAASAMSGPSYRVFLDAFAISSNIGDVSSRGEAQVVLGNLIGLGIGITITSIISNLPTTERLLPTFSTFAILASFHLTCTYQAISTVELKTLNWQRLEIIIESFLNNNTVPCIKDVNDEERFLSLNKKKIKIGMDLPNDYMNDKNIVKNGGERYMLYIEKKMKKIGIILREDAEFEDVIEGIAQSEYIMKWIDKDEVIEESGRWIRKVSKSLVKKITDQGWNNNKMMIKTGSSRYGQKIKLHGRTVI